MCLAILGVCVYDSDIVAYAFMTVAFMTVTRFSEVKIDFAFLVHIFEI